MKIVTAFMGLVAVGSLAAPFAGANEAALDKAASLELGVNLIDQETLQYLENFAKNPRETYLSRKKKYNADGTQVATDVKSESLRGNGQTNGGAKLTESFIQAKDKFLSRVCTGDVGQDVCLGGNQGRRGIAANDVAENLVDNGYTSSFQGNLYSMANAQLTRGNVDVQPWSSDYWAIASGILTKRYADDNFPDLNWHRVASYYSRGFGQAATDMLSPAEKYDLLVGDSNWTLSNAQLAEGRAYAFDSNGNQRTVETWMGICHGWAPAAYMDARPRNSVYAVAANGQQIEFRPDDIKALSVLKWANGQAVKNEGGRLVNASKFIGGRCNIKEDQVQRDPATGAVLNDDCFDTNPGAWHKSIVNQIGVLKKSFVLDVTFDYEVWNQPVVGYSYSYFNPRTMQNTNSLRNAIEPIGFSGDKFAGLRGRKYNANNRPSQVVGVIMNMSYVVETTPNTRSTDSEGNDAIRNVRYVYDLELGANGEIMGGEWYEDTHPDFLWTPAAGAFAWNNEDQYVSSYNPGAPVPANVTRVARQASANSVPLKAIVDGLIRAAQ